MAPDVRMGVANQAAQTSVATRDFEPWSGFGEPAGGIFIGGNASTLGSAAVQNKFSIGVFDADLNQFCVAHKSRDNRTTSDCHRTGADDRVFLHINNTGSAVVGEGEATALTSDGVTVNYPDAYPVAVQQFAILFGGADMRCKAGKITLDQALNATKDISSLPFEPKAVLFIGTKTTLDVASGRPTAPNVANDARMFIGAAVNDGSETQFGHAWQDVNGVNTTNKQVASMPSDTYALPTIIDSGGSNVTDGCFEVTAFGADSIEITKRLDATNHTIAYLVLGGADFYITRKTAPTTTGTQSESGIGLSPLGMLALATISTNTLDSVTENDQASSFSFGAFGPTSGQQGCIGVGSQRGAAPTQAHSHAKAVGIYCPHQDGATDFHDATIGGSGSWDSTGWTLDWTNVMGGDADHVWYLAMEDCTPAVQCRDVRGSFERGAADMALSVEGTDVRRAVSLATLDVDLALEARAFAARMGSGVVDVAMAALARAVRASLDSGAVDVSRAVEARALRAGLSAGALDVALGAQARGSRLNVGLGTVDLALSAEARESRLVAGQAAADLAHALQAIGFEARVGRATATATVVASVDPIQAFTVVLRLASARTVELDLATARQLVLDCATGRTAEVELATARTVTLRNVTAETIQ